MSSREYHKNWFKTQAIYLIPLLVIAVISFTFAHQDYDSAQKQALSWMNPVVTKNEVAALKWVEENTAEITVFASDIFGGELLMSKLREGTLGGDWAVVPNVVSKMYDLQYNFYETQDSRTAWMVARKYNASYAWVPDRNIFAGYEWKYTNYTLYEDSRFFEKVFDNGHRIYRVKQN